MITRSFRLCQVNASSDPQRPLLKPVRYIPLALVWACMSVMLSPVHGQVGISDVEITPHASSILEVKATQKGILIPRMSTAGRDSITGPATSLMIYNTTTQAYNYFDGTNWISMAAGNIKSLADADADTKVEVEKNPDEDLIRFSIAGNERLRLENKYLHTSWRNGCRSCRKPFSRCGYQKSHAR